MFSRITLLECSNWRARIGGAVFVIFIISLAAAEAAIGLGIMLALYRKFHSANIEKTDELRG